MMPRRTKVAFWSVAIGLGVIRAWTMQHYMSPDGMSYLDMGDAFWRGDWSVAINAYWSPMYSWLTGLALLIFRPSLHWEFATVQVLNLAIYVVVLICFGFFWREVRNWQKGQPAEPSAQGMIVWPAGSWMLLGYSIAAWAGLRLIGLETTSSDMLLAGFVYLASGLVVRIRRGLTSWSNFALLGLVLGLGYLAKSPMFPLAFVFLGVTLFSTGDWRRGVPRVFLALVVFLMVGGPLVVALSLARGHVTFGESGRVNYVMLYEGHEWPLTPEPILTENNRPEAPLPVAISSLRGVTYLPFYDHTRLTPRAGDASGGGGTRTVMFRSRIGRYLKIWTSSLHAYYDLFVLRQGHLVAAVLIMFFLGPDWRSSFRNLLQNWHVLIPACTALAAYAVLVVELRYVGPFIPVLWGGILPAIRLRDSEEFKKLPDRVTLIVAVLFAIQLFGYIGRDAASDAIDQRFAPHLEVAQSLRQVGLQPGDRVGVIGRGQRAYWARLGRWSIAAEIRPAWAGTFWWASPDSRKRSLEAFAQAGVKAVVIQVEQPPDALPEDWQQRALAEGWRRLGDTNRFVYLTSLMGAG